MAQYVKQANIFGRIGSGIGQGLAEQLPKEIERGRLAQGLQQLSQQQGQTPFQQFAGLASLPGTTPQIIQSGAELLRQQGIAEGFRNVGKNQGAQQQNPLRAAVQQQPQTGSQPHVGLKSSPTGLVTQEGTQAALQNYIPKNRDQLMARAADLYDQNRALYPNPEAAMQAAAQEDQQNQAISQAHQANRKSQRGVESDLRGQLQESRKNANALVPEDVYQQVENDVLDKVGRGEIKETEAIKEGQKQFDKISREYNDVAKLGNWFLPASSPKEVRRSIETSRQNFKARGDTRNFIDTLVGENGLSYPFAAFFGNPTSDYPELNSYLNKLSPLQKKVIGLFTQPTGDIEKETRKVLPQLAKLMGKDASPLAIGQELRFRGYDPSIWLEYLNENRSRLNLTENQINELSKTVNWFPNMNDQWLYTGAGLEKYVE